VFQPCCPPSWVRCHVAAAQLVKALLDRRHPRGRGEYGLVMLLGVVEGKKAFLEPGFEFTDFGEIGIAAGQSWVLR
jgi:hypothetical protein